MADFAATLSGERGKIGAADFGVLYDAYMREASPAGYGRTLSAMREERLRECEWLSIHLTRRLRYATNAEAYALVGLTGDAAYDRGREKQALRRLDEARKVLKALEIKDTGGDGDAGRAFLTEVAAVGVRLGFGIDIDRTKIGTYIGYLKVINAQNEAAEAAKAKKNRI